MAQNRILTAYREFLKIQNQLQDAYNTSAYDSMIARRIDQAKRLNEEIENAHLREGLVLASNIVVRNNNEEPFEFFNVSLDPKTRQPVYTIPELDSLQLLQAETKVSNPLFDPAQVQFCQDLYAMLEAQPIKLEEKQPKKSLAPAPGEKFPPPRPTDVRSGYSHSKYRDYIFGRHPSPSPKDRKMPSTTTTSTVRVPSGSKFGKS